MKKELTAAEVAAVVGGNTGVNTGVAG